MSEYGRRIVINRSFERALWSVMEAFVTAGFTINATSVHHTVRRAGRDLRRYVLLEALHPQVLWEALRLDLDIGVLLPCEIAVYELADGQTVVTAADPMAPAAYFASWRKDHPALAAVARDLENHVAEALRAVSDAASRCQAAA
jgi:uncharacterized protein (DUF302 family)